jgi:hypothetical protein
MGDGLRFCVFAAALACALAPRSARAELFSGGPADDIEAMINALQPGDELVLSGGVYTLTERFSFSLTGSNGAEILIRAADGETPQLHRPDANQNIIDVDYAEFVTLRGIEFSGGSAGIRISGARFFTIEDCEIHDTGDVAIRANDTGVTYESLRILRNHVHHTNNTGEGMYLGCNNAACEVVDSLIEGNYIHHTNQPSVSQGDGIELKEGSSGNVIRDNVIHDTRYPCILTYATNGAPNVIERNALWNCGDHGIQSAADAVIRNNIILSSGSDGIAMQPHQAGSPSGLRVVHNTVLNASGDAISLRGISGSVVVANNALYAQTGRAFYANGTNGLVFEGNVGAGGGSLPMTPGDVDLDFVAAGFGGAPPVELFPSSDGALRNGGVPSQLSDDDFNGTPRNGVADVGAYAYGNDGNPGWMIAEGLKSSGSTGGPGTGGPGGASGGPAGSGGTSGTGGEVPGTGGTPIEPPSSGGSSGCSVGRPYQGAGELFFLLGLSSLTARRRRFRRS